MAELKLNELTDHPDNEEDGTRQLRDIGTKLIKKIEQYDSAGTGIPSGVQQSDTDSDNDKDTSGGVVAADRKVSYYSKAKIRKNATAHFGPACSFAELNNIWDQHATAHFGQACSFAELNNIWDQRQEMVEQAILANREMVKQEMKAIIYEAVAKIRECSERTTRQKDDASFENAISGDPYVLAPSDAIAFFIGDAEDPAATADPFDGWDPAAETVVSDRAVVAPQQQHPCKPGPEPAMTTVEGMQSAKQMARVPGRPPDVGDLSPECHGTARIPAGDDVKRDSGERMPVLRERWADLFVEDDDAAGLSIWPGYVAKVEATDAPT